jgi:group I intron endonuclease
MKTKICGIYLITNTINGKVYVGQSKDMRKRWWVERSNYGNNLHLTNSIKKYGIKNFNFSVLKECPEDYLNDLECFFIRAYYSWNPTYGYNKTFGSNSVLFSENHRKNLSIAAKLKFEEGRDNLKDMIKGTKDFWSDPIKAQDKRNTLIEIAANEEYRERQRKSKKACWADPEIRQHYLDGGKREDVKIRESEASKNYWADEANRRYMVECRIGMFGWNNGIINKRSKECPGIGWVRGWLK